MNDEERDILVETRNDVKWLKKNAEDHKKQHDNYMFYLVTTAIAAFIGLFK